MSELDEILEVVDENNSVVGRATRGECYQKGLLHRAVNVFLFSSKGEIFLQKRSKKKGFPLYWDLSCSEHVKPGESFEEAAKRGLKEELGIKVEVEQIIPIHRINNWDETKTYLDSELIVTFKANFDGEIKINPEEVFEGIFFNADEFKRLVKYGKTKLTPWFLEDWKLLEH